MGEGTLWHLHRLLECIKYIIHEFTSSTILLHPPSPDFWSSFNSYHFTFTYMCTHFITLYLPSYPHSPTPLPSHGYHPSPTWQDLFCPLFSNFVGEKRENEKHDILTWDQSPIFYTKYLLWPMPTRNHARKECLESTIYFA
jgi:hypothetical protein